MCLGRFPEPSVIALGLVTVFAGYACIYALNDVTDYQLDRKRMSGIAQDASCFDLDCMFVRHPLAQGLIPLAKGVAWTAFWGVVALVGAALLNPVCAGIFVSFSLQCRKPRPVGVVMLLWLCCDPKRSLVKSEIRIPACLA